jgi:MFS family permease
LVGIIAQNFGWRATYLFAGSLNLAITVPLIIFVLKDNPESRGLLPDGDKPDEITKLADGKTRMQTPKPVTIVGNTGLFVYLKSPALWSMGVSFALAAIGYNAVTMHEVSFITHMNVSATIAALALGVTLGIGGITSFFSGWLADKLSSRYVAILYHLIAIVGMLILMEAKTISKVWVFVTVYGLGIGASGTLLPIVTRDIFGTANFSTVFGFTNVLFVAGFALGVPLAGFMFDTTGSYHSVFITVTIIYIMAILSLYFAFGVKPRHLLRPAVLKK